MRLVVDARDFVHRVEGLITRVENPRPVLKSFSLAMMSSVVTNFTEQGRPEKWVPLKLKTLVARHTRNNRELKQPKKVFVAVRGKGARTDIFRSLVAGQRGDSILAPRGKTISKGFLEKVMLAKILIDRGTLRNSISPAVVGNQAVVGTNLVYSRVHQLGYAAKKVPARPYLIFQDGDEDTFADLVKGYIEGDYGENGEGLP